MTDRELMQQALDALEGYARNCRCEGGGAPCDAAEALRARLAQPEQEPVAWMYEYGTDNGDAVNEVRWYKNVSLTQPVLTYNRNVVPLYTAPPQREWQGLMDEEIGMLTVFDGLHAVETPLLADFTRAIEAKLKEKNT